MKNTIKTLTLVLLFSTTTAFAGLAWFQYEITTGMTKQCVYSYLGSTYTITVGLLEFCPLSINI